MPSVDEMSWSLRCWSFSLAASSLPWRRLVPFFSSDGLFKVSASVAYAIWVRLCSFPLPCAQPRPRTVYMLVTDTFPLARRAIALAGALPSATVSRTVLRCAQSCMPARYSAQRLVR